jgi:hypothetical protein
MLSPGSLRMTRNGERRGHQHRARQPHRLELEPPTGQVVKRSSDRPKWATRVGAFGLQSTLSDGTSSYDYGATRIVAATTHQEGSFLSIAQAAVRHNQLARLFTTFHTERWSKALERIPGRGIRTRAQRELGRRAFPGIPVEQVESVGVIPELLHVVALRVPGTGVFSSRSLRAATSGRQRDRNIHRT